MPIPPDLPFSELEALLALGHTYLDVRTVEEYAAGHVPGAFNVPWQHGNLSGLSANPDFLASVAATLPRHRTLIVGCHSGARAARAQTALSGLGYGDVRLHREGWDGSRDAFGRRQPGWSALGKAVEYAAQPGRAYAQLHHSLPARPLRIAYFGLPLGALLLAGDGHALQFAALSAVPAPGKRRVMQLGCPVLDSRALGDALPWEVDAAFERWPIDLLVSWFWTRRLPKAWLDRPECGAVGVHPSLLPRHRGPNPYFWAIDSGDLETGVSVHRLTSAYDEGDVLLQSALPVASRNAWQLARALDRPSLALLRQAVQAFASGRPPLAKPQDETFVTWAPEPSGAALGFSPEWSVARLLRRIAALAPVPGLTLDIQGLELIVSEACSSTEPLKALEPGQAAVWGTPPRVLLRVGDGAVALTKALVLEADSEIELRDAALAERVAKHLREHALEHATTSAVE